MGKYFNPATTEAIKSVGGRQLAGNNHTDLIRELNPGEALGMFNDRLIFRQVADVTDPLEFEEFESQYRQGYFDSRSFYAMPKDVFH